MEITDAHVIAKRDEYDHLRSQLAKADLNAIGLKVWATVLERERDEARAQLAEANLRIAVLGTALARYCSCEGETCEACELTANVDPLAAAVGRVVAAAMTYVEGSQEIILGAKGRWDDLRKAVDDLRSVAPWWPTIEQ